MSNSLVTLPAQFFYNQKWTDVTTTSPPSSPKIAKRNQTMKDEPTGVQFEMEIEEKKPQVDEKDISYQKFRKKFSDFLTKFTCYDIMPTSGKVIVLDSQLTVQPALQAFYENDINACPLWDSKVCNYVGMLTIADLIQVLKRIYSHPETPELQGYKIEAWRDILKCRPLIYGHPSDTLFQTTQTLLKYKIHRIPLIDKENDNTILAIISHYRILKFLMNNVPKKNRSFLKTKLGDLKIGTAEDVLTVHSDTSLITILDHMLEKKISAIPIVDIDGNLVEIFSKDDVVALAQHPKFFKSFSKSVSEVIALGMCTTPRDLCTCTNDEKLRIVVERLLERRVRRVIRLDEGKVVGIISMTDILNFLVG
eukprot:TRINITY_DN14974_c0_g1_i1.p1 TRINITY_DN14974_c0_g1~~TRINITY_DN14974_c0_g1_i1.p1  ORF type:complete len:391 (+),score=68.25 TRINITY_DN14974_c0_g1_i1:81-1175(+)